MSQLLTEPLSVPAWTLTSHAMLVPWGLFAQHLGLIEALESVPIDQRRRDYKPQTKLIEFLVAILAGCAYLQDISRAPQPLDQDTAVAQAWQQAGWADYSGVSRTLKACTEETVTALREVLAAISRPFIEREVVLALRDQGTLIYDGDLTGRPVSNGSTTYPDAAFGWMNDAVQFGYQAAMVSLHSPTYGRQWLSVEQHPGDTVSVTQAGAMMRAAEASSGVRPRRRTELLVQRIEQLRALLQQAEASRDQAHGQLEQAQRRWEQVKEERQTWEQRVIELKAVYHAQNRPERPHSRLAQARRKLAVRESRSIRRERELEQARRRWERREQKTCTLRTELSQLERRLAQFTEDNRTNPWPVRIIFRLDGGFGSGHNIALLIEMGYEVYTKAYNHQVTKALRRQTSPNADWIRVGNNAEMVVWQNKTIANCPYPLNIALERFHTGDRRRHSVLLHYGEAPVTANPVAWFTFYNGRQDIEAGIKEGKQVFQMHHLKVRSAAGLVIQEILAAFSANFVRWAAVWLHEVCPDAPAPFDCPQPSVKQMVRIAANTLAWVMWQPGGCLLKFTKLSAFAGVQLAIQGSNPLQLALPLFKSRSFSPI
jgi:hypothetical protein